MTTIKRFNPDYKMHAVRFEAFARETEHGEYVRYDAHQQKLSALEAERDALAQRVEMLAQNLGNAIWGEQEALQRVNALAVENAAMRNALESIRIYSSDTLSGPSDSVPDMAACLREGIEHLHQVSTIQTPATDAALAAIETRAKVEAIELLIGIKKRELAGMHPDTHAFGAAAASLRAQINELQAFASTLREAK
ncbi:TPA: hypothetical protein ACXIZC_000476 [Serratia marcescens]